MLPTKLRMPRALLFTILKTYALDLHISTSRNVSAIFPSWTLQWMCWRTSFNCSCSGMTPAIMYFPTWVYLGFLDKVSMLPLFKEGIVLEITPHPLACRRSFSGLWCLVLALRVPRRKLSKWFHSKLRKLQTEAGETASQWRAQMLSEDPGSQHLPGSLRPSGTHIRGSDILFCPLWAPDVKVVLDIHAHIDKLHTK